MEKIKIKKREIDQEKDIIIRLNREVTNRPNSQNCLPHLLLLDKIKKIKRGLVVGEKERN